MVAPILFDGLITPYMGTVLKNNKSREALRTCGFA